MVTQSVNNGTAINLIFVCLTLSSWREIYVWYPSQQCYCY